MSRIADEVKSTVRLPRLVSNSFRSSYGDTGESGETYDAEAKAESWAGAKTTD